MNSIHSPFPSACWVVSRPSKFLISVLIVVCLWCVDQGVGASNGTTPTEQAGFRFEPVSDKSLGLWEGRQPVLVYNHGVLSKAGVPANRNRSTYIHPLYGIDGEVLTDDFPKDHYHHRGLFWAWPHVRIGSRGYDLWTIEGVHQRFQKWLAREVNPQSAVLGVENDWHVDGQKVMEERVWVRVYPADEDHRIIDLEFFWTPAEQPVTLAGAAGKSYGGLTLRYGPRVDTVITTPLGTGKEDLAVTRLPWADLSARFEGRAKPSGAAIFIGTDHPDFPPTWLTRHYGVLCVGWPGVEPQTFQPGATTQAKYRLWIHRGQPDREALQKAYDAYCQNPGTKAK
jgi:hypothetical protein